MSLLNLRSLLLAVIVLSNCITWAASRHHYTHTISGHRSRHRRQGAGLYLSGSYVLPGGEGTGWGEWGEVSPCSRTCGGGVASQKRICLKLGPDGQPQCSGGDTKYFSCQTQDCPAGSKDYRAQQCSEFDDVFFRSNIKYKWVPYTNSPFPCELNCMPHGERFYYRHRTKVVDGTRCNDESFDVCVNGTCQPVGCDMMLGSSAREDKCRECRGNGANCQTSSGILDTQDLRKGYTDLLLIPQGATTIVIEELAPSRNYLALRAENGTYYLNGYYHIDFPRSLVIAGALWTYERNQQGFAAPDKLRCLGPTTEPLYLALLLQGTNVGIKYEYSVPNAIAPPKNKRYNWVHEEFTPCSVSCGGGFQTRNVTCRLEEELEVVDENLCDKGMKPASNQSCSTERCPAQWTTSAWGRCSKRCGEGGVMARDVTCTQIISNGYPSNVDETKCIERLGEKPEQFQKCNVNATCPEWFTGPWKPCDKLCDQGKQKRQVVCYQKVGGRIEVFEDSECEGEKPAVEQPCMLTPCLGVDWVLSEWSGCDTCLSKNRSRTAKCSTTNKIVVDDKFCAHHKMPVTQEMCDTTKLPPCDVQWYATQWSKCSVDCGKGVQTRDIFCGLYDGKSVQKVDDSKCADQPKYNDTKDCEVPKDKCPFKWFASGWSECTQKCDGGLQYRRVMCIRGGVSSGSDTLCDNSTIPFRTQSCNTQSCDEVTDINDDGCSENELYPESGLELTEDNSTTTMSDSPYYETNETTTVGEMESPFDTNTTTTLEFEELLPFVGGNSSVATIVDSEETSPLDDEISTTSEYDSTTDFSFTTDETYENGTTESNTKTPNISTPKETKIKLKPDYKTTPKETEIKTSSGVVLDTTTTEETTNPTTATEIPGDISTTEEISTSTSSVTETTVDTSTTEDINTTVEITTNVSTVTETTVDSNATEDTINASVITMTPEDSNTTIDITTSASTVTETTYDTNTTEDANTTVEVTTSASTATETTVDDTTTENTNTTAETSSSTVETIDTITTEDSNTTVEITTSASTITETTVDTTTTELTTTTTTITESSEDINTTTEITSSTSTVTETTLDTNTTEEAMSSISESTEKLDTTTPKKTAIKTKSKYKTTPKETEIFTGLTLETTTTEETINATTTSESLDDNNTTIEITTSASTVTETTVDTTTTEDTNTTVEITTSASTVTETTVNTTATEDSTNATTITETPEDTNATVEITSASTVTEITVDSTTVEITTNASTVTETTVETTTTEDRTNVTTETPEDTNTTVEITSSASTVTETTVDTATTELFSNATTVTGIPEESNTTIEITTSMVSSEGTESSSEVTTSPEGLTSWDLSSTVIYYTTKAKGIRVCKPRTCNETMFGCCPDNIKPALGTFDKGCDIKNKTCKETEHGCCPDGLSPANGPGYEGCPLEPCEETLFGCCRSDNKTAAEGNDQEGCPPPPPACLASEYGCCKDGETEPTGPGKEGCLETMTTTTTAIEISSSEIPSETPMTSSEKPVTSSTSDASETSTSILPTQAVQSCGVSEYGCCYDNTTAATGPDQQGCPCHATEFGCCTDGVTPAHGLDYEGCCLLHAFGCCPDNIKPADGPHFKGCGCQRTRFGCCPDNVTIATGPDHKGCGCQYSEYGCCPDGHTEALAVDFTGCSCHTYQFGCCPDGVTAAQGPGGHGCYCQQATFGCCGDEQTHAKGPNKEGCDCATSKYGCCLDGIAEATGPKFQGCADKPENRQAACKLEIDRGSCKNYSVNWYYDTEYGGCSRFWYGGCEGNGNRFGSKEECEDICVSPPPKDACKLPQVKGACLGYDIRWYYDNDHDSCSTFVYGGCLGNDNNFESRELCQAQCEPERAKDECSLALERGSCGGNYSRWGYNKAARRCEEFVWGGCEGNPNRFSSEAACQLRCNPPGKPQPECLELQDIGNCTDTKALWTFSQSENRCLPFYYTGCGGNGNKFRTREDCEEACPSAYVPELCTLPASIGECSDYTEKWYFDTQLQRCRLFYYGGCGGNDNKFNSERECENRCALTTTAAPTTSFTTTVAPSVAPAVPTVPAPQPGSQLSVPELCALPYSAGDCYNYTEKWYFDVTYQRCRPFYYGGCGGNGNKFGTERECENRCSLAALTTVTATTAAPATRPRTDLSEICFMAIDEGPCNNLTERWAYDTAMGKCVSFQFGGCGGNQNNFPSDKHCSSFCKPVQDTCQLPMLAGPCSDSVMQWFYDAATDSCSQFTYGGCEGNDNRFNSREECENRCKTGPAPSSATSLTTSTTKIESNAKKNPEPQCVISGELEPCEGAGEVWYYDEGTSTCTTHQNQEAGVACRYTGTFYSEEACERACGAFKDLAVCGYEVQPGPCRSFVPKYFYNSSSHRCEGYAYGGCLGGPNRFSTDQECRDICMATVDPCILPPEPGNCINRIVMWYYDARFDRCDQFAYGGCGGNENKFESQDLCEGRCRKRLELTTTTTPAPLQTTRQPAPLGDCSTPTSLEPCGADVLVFYYDEATSSCKPSNFGGCRYRNSYSSEEECERQCGSFRGQDVCRASLDPGPCRGSFPKFYFDAATGNCVEFTYGGCQGGTNRFSTAQECQYVCGSSGPGRECLQTVETGRSCGGGEPGERRWHYDTTSADCLVFVYQGCGGNENNFRSYEDCAVHCRVLPSLPASRLCDQYAEECISLEKICTYGIRSSLAPEGCERCSCETPVDCGPQRRSCESLNCTYGVDRTVAENGCETCKCYEDPCIRSNCNPNERCVASPYRDLTTKEVLYTARCEPENITNEVLPDCEAAIESCERLSCTHGKTRTRDANGCDRCWCRDNPCNLKLCAADERCITTPFHDPVTRDLRYTAHCRPVNKEGECSLGGPPAYSTESGCHSDCNDDADCRGVLKCCIRGCSRLCLEPSPPTPRTTTHTTAAAEIPQAPQASLETKPEVVATEGGKATLRCIIHGNPPPRITWRFGEITIDGDFDRYRLLSDGALEIVSLYRNDSGVYICVAANELGIAQQQITLQVADPVNGPSEIAGSPGATVTGELDQPITMRCLAYGYPEPAIYWFRGRGGPMVPYSNALYEARGNELRIRRLAPETLGEYECQAYNGVDPVATWTVTVLAYQPENNYPSGNRYFVPREVVVTPRVHTTHRTTLAPQQYPEPQQLPQPEPVPSYPVTEPPQAPQASSETEPEVVASEGGKATLRCIFHGNPPPRITWRFGEITIDNDFGRYRLLSDGALEIVSLYRSDSGVYICVAANELGTAEQQITLQVADTPQAPQASSETEPQVMASEGGKATLRCIFHGNPSPRISWRFGEITIDNDAGRYRLLSDGALEIVSLYRNDSGVYICVAANELGTAEQQIMLQVTDPVNGPAGIVGSPGATVTGELGQSITIRCLAYGYPEPAIYWYRGRGGEMVPYSDALYEARGNELQIRRLTPEALGEYECQAYNGVGPAVTWTVTVLAYQPENDYPSGNQYYVPREVNPLAQTTHRTSLAPQHNPEPRPDASYFVPVSTRLLPPATTVTAGSQLSLPCEVSGYPEPEVHFTKDGAPLAPNDRVWISGSRLTIERASVADSGEYGCYAANAYSSHSSTAQITVQELYIPAKCIDNPTFANCALIVQSRFCVHKYYSRFCCKSCVEAGQLNPRDAEMQADEPFRKK